MVGSLEYVKYDEKAQSDSEKARALCESLKELIGKNIKPGRATDFAITKLEECFMWIGKGIRDDLVYRTEAEEAAMKAAAAEPIADLAKAEGVN